MAHHCNIRASVTTGLEFLAAEEITEKLSISDLTEGRGFVTWQQEICSTTDALQLRIIDHLEVVMSKHTLDFSTDKKDAVEQIADLLPDVDWPTGFQVWALFSDFKHPVSLEPVDKQGMADDSTSNKLPIPRYRATCYRTGANHVFGSPDVSHRVGGVIQDRFGWDVNLTDFDIEVVITVVDNEVTFGLALTKKSLYHRNISQFARTTLKANICAGLLRLCKIQKGDIVLDPMCGSGSITLEGAIEHPEAFHVAGDIQEFCVQCSITNILALNDHRKKANLKSLNSAVMQFDATKLPFSNNSVDVVVSDLPFGKRMGNKIDNRKLYPMFLTEAARVTQPETGRAVLLTADRNCMKRVLPQVRDWWAVPRTAFIYHGGLRACIYILKRTAKIW